MANKWAACVGGCGRRVAICNKDWARLREQIEGGTYQCRKCRSGVAFTKKQEVDTTPETVVEKVDEDSVAAFEAGMRAFPLPLYTLKK